jgi:hypothetical protein
MILVGVLLSIRPCITNNYSTALWRLVLIWNNWNRFPHNHPQKTDIFFSCRIEVLYFSPSNCDSYKDSHLYQTNKILLFGLCLLLSCGFRNLLYFVEPLLLLLVLFLLVVWILIDRISKLSLPFILSNNRLEYKNGY